MNKAVQIFLAVIAIGFASAAIVVSLQMLTGERPAAYLYPCFLMAGGALTGVFAWNFNLNAGASETCSSDSLDSISPPVTIETD